MLVTTRLLQEDMGDPGKWGAQSQEQQTSRARQLNQDERQCRLVSSLILSPECELSVYVLRSYLTLARETVDMFHYLTQDIQTPFLKPELADRLAAMLDHVLDQLTNGPKCKYASSLSANIRHWCCFVQEFKSEEPREVRLGAQVAAVPPHRHLSPPGQRGTHHRHC